MAIIIEVFHIEGISPLLMHNPAAMGGGGGTKSAKVKKIPSPQEEAEAGCYRDAEGNFYLPGIAFKSALGKGAAGRRIGKAYATTLVAGAVFEAEERVPLFDPDTAEPCRTFEVHTARAVVQRNGVLRSRPMVRRWAAKVALEIDTDFITGEIVADILAVAGRMAGVGDWRPEKKGRYGRFQVVANGHA